MLAFIMYILNPAYAKLWLRMYVLSLTLRLVGVGLVLGLELEVLVCRAQEHFPESMLINPTN